MRPAYITDNFVSRFIKDALQEDLGEGDHSTLASIPAEANGMARLLVKDDGVLAGVEMAEIILRHYDASLIFKPLIPEGSQVTKGDVAFTIKGPIRSILTTERLVLNCMQRMSGIATKTRKYGDLIKGTGARLLDTRKTTPLFRLLEKWAVQIGGGENHRLGLYDMIMLKDNHIDAAGGIEQAINRTKQYLRDQNKKLRIEVETRSVQEVKTVLALGGIDMIMLDNMSVEELRECVKLINKRYPCEASGGIDESTIQEVAMCGVDYISVGALTHSYESLDLSLKISKEL